MSGNFAESGSRVLAFPLDVGFCVRSPFLVDLDEDGADEPQQGFLARKDPDFGRAALQLLLHRALHRFRGAQSAAMVLGQREDGEAFGHVLLEPCGQLRRGVAIAGDQLGQRALSEETTVIR